MRTIAFITASLAVLAAVPAAARAQVTLGPEVAVGDGNRGVGIGGAGAFPMPNLGAGFGLLVDLLIFFPDVGDYLEANGSLTYDFPLQNSTAVPFVLAGLSLASASDDTNLALNLGAGLDFDLGKFRPKAGIRLQIESSTGIVIFMTLPLAVGN